MGKSCVRVLVVIFNVLFVMIGLALLGLALWVYLDKTFHQYKGLNKDVFNILLFAIMGIGGLTALIALCGCCGALYMSPCLLGVFFSLLLVIFLVELAVALLGFFMPYKVQGFINDSTKLLVESAKKDDRTWGRLEATQLVLKCCGDVRGAKAFTDKFPASCCTKKIVGNPVLATCSETPAANSNLVRITTTCPARAFNFFKKYRLYVFAALVGVAALELIGMIFAMILCCYVRRYEEEGYVGVNT